METSILETIGAITVYAVMGVIDFVVVRKLIRTIKKSFNEIKQLKSK